MDGEAHIRLIPETLAGKRLDQALAAMFPEYSRSRLKTWLLAGRVTVDAATPRPRDTVLGGERVCLELPVAGADDAAGGERMAPAPQPVEFGIVHEDDAVLIADKPAGLVVHPGAGNRDGTLQNGLLHLRPGLAGLPRAGIVHRLDKDTSGLLLVAKTLAAHTALVRELAARRIEREYRAVCCGVLTGGGRIDAPLGRHRVHRTRMAVRPAGRPAVTHYRVLQRFAAHTYISVSLETGRTHQIRVHFAAERHPLLGDPVYGGRLRLPPGADEDLAAVLRGLRRQALHASRLAFPHPATGERLECRSPLPADLVAVLEALARHAGVEPLR